jgi:type IV pilus assembly protein PilM
MTMGNTKRQYALDIGNNSIKYICYEPAWKGPEILDIRIQKLPADFLALPSIVDKITVLKSTIDAVLDEVGGTEKKEITIALPADMTVVRYITLPNIPSSKIDKIMRFEAEQQIPLPFQDVEWAYAVLPVRKRKEVDVVVTAVLKNIVQSLAETIQSHGFTIRSFETGQLMLANLVKFYGCAQNGTILLDMGAMSTHVLIFCKGALWGRTLRFGMFRITRALSERLRISLQEAEVLKKKYVRVRSSRSSDGLPEVSAEKLRMIEGIFEEVLYEIVNEVSRTISYYLSVMRGALFNQVLITGGGANIEGMSAFLEKNLGIETKVADFSTRCIVRAHIQERFRVDKNYYSVALAIAGASHRTNSIATNLISEPVRERRRVEQYRNQYIFFFSIALAALLVIMGALSFEAQLKQKRQIELAKRFAQIETAEQNQKRLEKGISRRVAVLEIIDERIDERTFFLGLFRMLHNTLPENIWLESFDYDAAENRIIISGKTTGTLDDITAFKDMLEGLEYVHAVNFDAARIDESSDANGPLRYFSMSIIYNHERKKV